MPERARNNSVRLDNWRSDAIGLVARAMPQVNTRTTVVRPAVARLESTPATPILARMAVIPAKKADSKAHVIQFMGESLLDGDGPVNQPWPCGVGLAPGLLHDHGRALSKITDQTAEAEADASSASCFWAPRGTEAPRLRCRRRTPAFAALRAASRVFVRPQPPD